MKVVTGGGGLINEPEDEDVQCFWYVHDSVSGCLSTMFSDVSYEPRYAAIHCALRRLPGESLADFKERCTKWDESVVVALWYTYESNSGCLRTWFSDGTYQPPETHIHAHRIHCALRRQPGESLAGFKERCEKWEGENE